MRALATWSIRHRRQVAAFWLLALVIATLAVRSAGGVLQQLQPAGCAVHRGHQPADGGLAQSGG